MTDDLQPLLKDALERKCKNCQWWVAREDMGECRADKPVVIQAGDNRGVWPLTRADEWCQFFANNYRRISRPDVIKAYLAGVEAAEQKGTEHKLKRIK